MFRSRSQQAKEESISFSQLNELLDKYMAGDTGALASQPSARPFFNKLEAILSEHKKNEAYALKEVNRLNQYIMKMDFVKEMVVNLNEQLEATDMVTASSEQISNAIIAIAEHVSENARAAEKSLEITENGSSELRQAVKSIGSAFELTDGAKQRVQEVTHQAVKINEMVSIIESVAEQTNLLALNASIEAARAGDAGRGFAVVANEIKKLADDTKESVKLIQSVVSSLNTSVNSSVSAMEQATVSFKLGVDNIQKATSLVEGSEEEMRTILNGMRTQRDQIETQTAATQELTSSIMHINENIKILFKQTNRTGKAFSDIATEINNYRIALIQRLPEIAKNLIIDIAITDHLNWRWTVYNMILGYHDIELSKVGSHHDCRLGKWIDEKAQHVPEYKSHLASIHGPHEKMHKAAQEAVRAYSSGDVDTAEKHLACIDDFSMHIVSELSNMIAATLKTTHSSYGESHFAWTSDLSVFNKTIDDQHKKLLQLGDQLEKFSNSPSKNREDFVRITNELKDYTVYHFDAEEKMLDKAKYPALDAHKQIHKRFVAEISNVDYQKFDYNDSEAMNKLILLVSRWVIQHIKSEDFKYQSYLRDNR